jgi:hypothetical protein
MSIDPAVKRLIGTIADATEAHFVTADGSVDQKAHNQHILDAIEQRHEDVSSLLSAESPLWVVESVVNERDRKSHAAMKKQYAEMAAEAAGLVASQLELPDFDKVKRVKVRVHKGGQKFEKKFLLSCRIFELDIIDQSYGGLADTILQHQQFVRMLAKVARAMGFKETDTVRDLYRKSA